MPPNPTREGDVYRWRGRLLYRFHATYRDERLFDPRADPYETRDLAPERGGEVARMRAAFLARLRLRSLDEVPRSMEEWLRLADGLGYLSGGGADR
ncbi:MAG: hypothetical protein L6R43_04960 [Planctomycetes bacterium]|nr:hypothetical protein [Planctomycetota bacterium]